jgi:hypothetical protein
VNPRARLNRSAPLPPAVAQQLLALQAQDLAVRAELEAAGELHGGYHPRMAAVHRANAQVLRQIINRHGWPDAERLRHRDHSADEASSAAEAAEAAWLIAQHAIGEPGFMRRCRACLKRAVRQGHCPAWQWAYLDDRIRSLEGRPQRHGTQFDITPQGPRAGCLDKRRRVDDARRRLGWPPLHEHLSQMPSTPWPTPEPWQAFCQAREAWRRQVGWQCRGRAAARRHGRGRRR